jgi:hypothetical protein
MPVGPGKYDDACTAARLATGAEAIVLLVGRGLLGSGFSVQTASLELLADLPKLLREIADEIERSGP